MRRLIRLSVFVVSTWFFQSPMTAQAQLRYDVDASGGLIPYDYTGNPAHPGIYAELIPMLMGRAGIEIESVVLPTKRAVKALEEGLLDFDFVNPDWFGEDELLQGYVFSVPIFPFTESFYRLADKPSTINSLDDLAGQSVGTVAGYMYVNEKYFERVDFASEQLLVKGLSMERFDVAIIEQAAAQFWSKELGIPLYRIMYSNTGHMVLRLRAEHIELLPSINQAIQSAKNDGSIRRLMDSYTRQNASSTFVQ